MAGSCWCGRSESGICTGLHKFSEAEYKKFLEEKSQPKEEKQVEVKMQNDMPQVYTEEVVNKIIEDYSKLSVEAWNTRDKKFPEDYRKFWVGVKSEGDRLLGLARHLKSVIDQKVKEDGKER
tara:strand:+ start:30 stop:395 length:366 start_codon:yes stop_codon:yes gene_type:complete